MKDSTSCRADWGCCCGARRLGSFGFFLVRFEFRLQRDQKYARRKKQNNKRLLGFVWFYPIVFQL